MPHDDLDAAASAARYLASMAASIRALPAAGATEDTIKRLTTELNQRYPDAHAAIRAVAIELRRARDRSAVIGDIVAPTAHEVALEMVHTLNRERFGVEIVGRKCVEVWPNADQVIAEIELEYEKAKHARGQNTPLSPQEPPPPPEPRLRVDLARKTVTLDGVTRDVDSDNALRWIKVLTEHPGEWVSGAELKSHDPDLQGDRTDRWRELWNPKTGVRHCYAGELTERYGGRKGWPESFDRPALFPQRLDEALRWPDLTGTARLGKPWLDGLPRLIFLNDMGDSFTESLPLDWLAPDLPRMATSPHQLLLLTKRPRRMAEFSRSHPLPANVWPGTSVTSMATLSRIEALRGVVGGGVRWVSAEPLLEYLGPDLDLDGIDWVIVGGESGAGYRPMEQAWALSISGACRRAGIPFFFKQSAGLRPETGIELLGKVIREMPRLQVTAT